MPRVNVWLPEQLHQVVRERLPHVNISELLQRALRELLACRHHELVCAACAEPIDRFRMVDDALGRFYQELLGSLEELLHAGGTLEGAARAAKDVAGRHQVTLSGRLPLHRLSRARRAELGERWAADLAQRYPHAVAGDERGRYPYAAGGGPTLPAEPPEMSADHTVSELPREHDSRDRHPTARRATGAPAPNLDVEDETA